MPPFYRPPFLRPPFPPGIPGRAARGGGGGGGSRTFTMGPRQQKRPPTPGQIAAAKVNADRTTPDVLGASQGGQGKTPAGDWAKMFPNGPTGQAVQAQIAAQGGDPRSFFTGPPGASNGGTGLSPGAVFDKNGNVTGGWAHDFPDGPTGKAVTNAQIQAGAQAEGQALTQGNSQAITGDDSRNMNPGGGSNSTTNSDGSTGTAPPSTGLADNGNSSSANPGDPTNSTATTTATPAANPLVAAANTSSAPGDLGGGGGGAAEASAPADDSASTAARGYLPPPTQYRFPGSAHPFHSRHTARAAHTARVAHTAHSARRVPHLAMGLPHPSMAMPHASVPNFSGGVMGSSSIGVTTYPGNSAGVAHLPHPTRPIHIPRGGQMPHLANGYAPSDSQQLATDASWRSNMAAGQKAANQDNASAAKEERGELRQQGVANPQVNTPTMTTEEMTDPSGRTNVVLPNGTAMTHSPSGSGDASWSLPGSGATAAPVANPAAPMHSPPPKSYARGFVPGQYRFPAQPAHAARPVPHFALGLPQPSLPMPHLPVPNFARGAMGSPSVGVTTYPGNSAHAAHIAGAAAGSRSRIPAAAWRHMRMPHFADGYTPDSTAGQNVNFNDLHDDAASAQGMAHGMEMAQSESNRTGGPQVGGEILNNTDGSKDILMPTGNSGVNVEHYGPGAAGNSAAATAWQGVDPGQASGGASAAPASKNLARGLVPGQYHFPSAHPARTAHPAHHPAGAAVGSRSGIPAASWRHAKPNPAPHSAPAHRNPSFAAAMARERADIRAHVGGARPGDRPQLAHLRGLGPVVINTGEKIVPTPNGDAVLNRQMRRAGLTERRLQAQYHR